MPVLDNSEITLPEIESLTRLPFKPITRAHILHCSYDYWYHKYRSSSLQSRIIPLPSAFLDYLRQDGIVLPADSTPMYPSNQNSGSEGWDEDTEPDPCTKFSETHQQIKDAIKELEGLVAPKLNWSAPKDATWIMMKKNSMECSCPNDVYLLLKSSDFITHDLEHAFDECAPDENIKKEDIGYILVLRKWFKVNPSCEYRCFVRENRLVGICQRDLNYFGFLLSLIPTLRKTIQSYFDKTLKNTFPDENFVFDIYLPEPYNKVRLMDINPWAPRTDPLLFSWLELLTMPLPKPLLGLPETTGIPSSVSSTEEDTQDEDAEEILWKPEIRLVKRDDPEAYSFATPQYSAHKLPKDVVEASMTGERGMREFADNWKRMLNGQVEMHNGANDLSDTE